MTPASKTRFEMILGVKEHEMHHRAQLMLIERMLGVVPHLTREMQARIAGLIDDPGESYGLTSEYSAVASRMIFSAAPVPYGVRSTS